MKKALRFIPASLLFFIALGILPDATAQIFNNYSSNPFLNSDLNATFQKTWATAHARSEGRTKLAAAMDGSAQQGSTHTTPSPAAPTEEEIMSKVPADIGAFQSNGRRIMIPVMLKDAKKFPQEEQDQAAKLLEELANNYENMVAEQGQGHLKNNVAGAVVFAIQTSRIALGKPDINTTASNALLDHVNLILYTNKSFKGWSNERKQKMYETCVIAGGLAYMYYQQGTQENNKEKIETGRDLATFIWEIFFDRDVNQVKFTKKGVEFKK